MPIENGSMVAKSLNTSLFDSVNSAETIGGLGEKLTGCVGNCLDV